VRIGIQSWGSEGDMRPLVALADRLRRAGHEPRLVLTPVDAKDYGPVCKALGISLKLVPEPMDFSLEELHRRINSTDSGKLMRALVDHAFYPFLEAMYAASLELCATCDVVVGHFSAWSAKAAAVKTGARFAALHYYPGVIPSRHVAPPGFPTWRWLNRPGWALINVVLNLAFRSRAAKFFASKGLPPVRQVLDDLMLSPQLNLLAASPSLFPPPPDWSTAHRVCGDFTMPDEHEPWEPSPSLRAFLDGGEKPVMLSLGSMEHLDPQRARNLLIASARQAGVRAIIQTKSSERREEGQDGDLYFLPWAPHRRLLPLCSAVVHHGGAGTSHSALRAGKPSFVLPFIFEQQMWAARLQAAGTAEGFLSFWKATPEKIAPRIRQAAQSEPLRQRAAEIASAMAREDGTGTATQLLEALAR
jgi:sterol 3beta-glucosyltransferase